MSGEARHNRLGHKLGAALLGAALLLGSPTAHAEGPVTPTGKGIAGGILLGAELVIITEALIGVDDWWPYLVFGVVGGAGGGVGGYFVETAEVAEPSLYMLAGGMALIMPSVILMLNATAWEPGEDLEEGEADVTDEGEPSAPGEPAGEPQPPAGVPGGEAPEGRRSVPRALIGIAAKRVTIGVPPVEIRPSYTVEEMARYGVSQATEVHIPLLQGAF